MCVCVCRAGLCTRIRYEEEGHALVKALRKSKRNTKSTNTNIVQDHEDCACCVPCGGTFTPPKFGADYRVIWFLS